MFFCVTYIVIGVTIYFTSVMIYVSELTIYYECQKNGFLEAKLWSFIQLLGVVIL